MWVCRLPVHIAPAGWTVFSFKTCREVRIRRSPVGADAHIGPLGSHGFAVDSRKNRCGLRADRVVRPYGIRVHRSFAANGCDRHRPLQRL